jgi:hypothetical protein
VIGREPAAAMGGFRIMHGSSALQKKRICMAKFYFIGYIIGICACTESNCLR